MKKLIILLIITFTLFLSCTDKKYENYYSYDFIDFEWIVVKGSRWYILRDKYTDVLYVASDYRLSPIMKADGTCLTYTEWKETYNKE